MPLLDIRPRQMDIQLGCALSGMTHDLLKDGRGATVRHSARESTRLENASVALGPIQASEKLRRLLFGDV